MTELLPSGWKNVALGSITSKVGSGATPRGGERAYKPSGTPLIRSMNVHFAGFRQEGLVFIDDMQARALDGATVAEGDVLLNITGASIGRVALAPAAMTAARVNQHVSIIRPTEEVLPEFLALHFSSPEVQRWINEENYGVTRQALTKQMLIEHMVALPPIEEQRRIVARIEALFARTRRARADLERALLLSGQGSKALLSVAYSGEWLPSERDGTPSASRPLTHFIRSLDQGWSPKCNEGPRATSAEWAVIKTTAIQDMRFDEHENKSLPKELRPRPAIQISPGDIVVTRAGPRSRVGISCLVEHVQPRLMLCDKAYRLRVNGAVASPAYVVFMLNSPQIKDEIEKLKSGISDSGLNLTQDKFLDLPIPFRPLGVQQAISSRLRAGLAGLNQAAADCRRTLVMLDALEERILALGFRGELLRQNPAASTDELANISASQSPCSLRHGDATE